jgi:hypothetical protein
MKSMLQRGCWSFWKARLGLLSMLVAMGSASACSGSSAKGAQNDAAASGGAGGTSGAGGSVGRDAGDDAPGPDATTAKDGPVSPDAPADLAAGVDLPGDGLPGDGGESAVGACSTRTGGALVTFGICSPSQRLTVWITNSDFIAEAIARKGQKSRIPNMELVAGKDCDPQYPWHVNPATAQFADAATEVCDACPNLVDLRNHYYCPWTTSVIDVVDRR